ncbi:hypothetical protein Q1695_007102 [Nippostrongylus brasiliensis]|nr:hypothetical protein Q1695_007102 [Nippostrongylus brasiliensis]
MSDNFRKNLISKCIRDSGTGELDADVLNEVMNGTSDIDVVRLRTYAWRHTIARVHLVQMYKYMLGISSAYPETREVVEQHRRDEAMVLLRCLITTRSTNYELVDGQVTDPEPNNDDVLKMILLANNRLTDAFMRDIQTMIISAIHQEVRLSEAAREGSDKFWEGFDIEVWLRTGCCALLRSERAMQRVMDKLCTGMHVVPLVKALTMDYLESAGNRYGKGFKDAGVTMTEDGELRMVNRAIETIVFETMQKKPARISELRTRNTERVQSHRITFEDSIQISFVKTKFCTGSYK